MQHPAAAQPRADAKSVEHEREQCQQDRPLPCPACLLASSPLPACSRAPVPRAGRALGAPSLQPRAATDRHQGASGRDFLVGVTASTALFAVPKGGGERGRRKGSGPRVTFVGVVVVVSKKKKEESNLSQGKQL